MSNRVKDAIFVFGVFFIGVPILYIGGMATLLQLWPGITLPSVLSLLRVFFAFEAVTLFSVAILASLVWRLR